MVSKKFAGIVTVGLLLVGGLSSALLLVVCHEQAQTRRADYFGSTKTYDLKGGQEMRPRW
ncbi:DUF2749 domain-containing protein [Ensifer sp. ENS11]|uniref:DUF2749 domain-containing protein n=1 Tax=Ensifer sp. ENS11 TaxID=2769291 RepID=UPI001781CD7C|nr:DUF2749 domain-containing protein [Ensifer sp. ENS11]MBD9489957.1 DUF2749 domain-containing protein [Ensifer sp. ENS11]